MSDSPVRTNQARLHAEVERIGREIARPAAPAVDLESRFPSEAFDALRAARILSAGIPEEWGGGGCNVVEQAHLVTALARHCASAGMVLGMHFIKVETFVHHGRGIPQFEEYLKSVASEQRLVGSVTSEVGVGGNLRTSIAAVESSGDRFHLLKKSTCLSYGAEADDLLITCRKDSDAVASDQVVVLARRGDFELTKTGNWNAMGMRGTVSPPFDIDMEGDAWQVLPESFAHIAGRTMLPVTHILWSAIWLGIAEDAVARARVVIRDRSRKTETLPVAAYRLVQLGGTLQLMQSLVESAAVDFQRAHDADDLTYLTGLGYALKINNVKMMASQLVSQIAAGALDVIGFQGYATGGDASVARHIRDSHSAALMISNDRIIEANAVLQLALKGD